VSVGDGDGDGDGFGASVKLGALISWFESHILTSADLLMSSLLNLDVTTVFLGCRSHILSLVCPVIHSR
jgi:hypothetical protein